MTKHRKSSNIIKNSIFFITAAGSLAENPKSLAEMERTMHHREGGLRSVSSVDHPMDEKICGIKRSNSDGTGLPVRASQDHLLYRDNWLPGYSDVIPRCWPTFSHKLVAREATLPLTRRQPTMYSKRNRGYDWWTQRNIIYINTQ